MHILKNLAVSGGPKVCLDASEKHSNMYQVTVPHQRIPRGLFEVKLHRDHASRNSVSRKQVVGSDVQVRSQSRLDAIKINSHNFGDLFQSRPGKP